HCAVCGRRMNGQARVSRARTWRYYVCRSFDTKSARADEVEHALLDAVTTMRLPERSIEAARQELLNRLNVPSKPAASNLRARLQQRLTRLLQLYSWGDLPEAEYRREAQSTRDLIATLPDADKVVSF